MIPVNLPLMVRALFLSTLMCFNVSAQEPQAQDPLSTIQSSESGELRLSRIGSGKASPADWQWAVVNMANKDLRTDIRAAIVSRDPYPRKELVGLLTDSKLAVRLGALEILEEATGEGYGFNPWASPSGEGADPANEHAIAGWQKWAGQSGKVKTSGFTLSAEQMQSYIRDIISGNADRKRRAIRMLEPHGMKAVVQIQSFLTENVALPDSSRIPLKEAQYHLVLVRTSGENASVLARDLTMGNRDQQLGAISALKKSGFLAIPIVRDFLDSEDALVRETAVDTILILGGAQTVPLVLPSLKKERDVNVIHAAMRRFREIGGAEVRDTIAGYLDRDDEDLVVSSIESLTKFNGGGSDSFSSSSPSGKASATKEIKAKVVTFLDDPRWRIRAAALAFVATTKDRNAENKVIELLADEDEFVRASAISTAVALSLKKSESRLKEMFLSDDEMISPACKALTRMGIVPSAALIAHLDSRDPDIIVGALRAMDCDKKPFLEIIARYASHENLDVACAALRGMSNESDKVKFDFVSNHLTSALLSGEKEKVTAVLGSLSLPGNNRFSSYGGITPSLPGTSLDPLYQAFISPGVPIEKEKPVEIQPSKKAAATGGVKSLKDALATFVNDWEQPERAMKSSMLLANVGDERGLVSLSGQIKKLSVSQRAAIADHLYDTDSSAAQPLVIALMQDEISDIRQDAAEKAFNRERNSELIKAGLQQLEVEGGRLRASEVYGYNIESLARQGQSKRIIRDWCVRVLADEKAEQQTSILALILMRQVMSRADIELMAPFTKDASQWVRRAAWYSLSRSQSMWMSSQVQRLVEDPSPRVREALPLALNVKAGKWYHYFSDNKMLEDRSWESSSKRIVCTEQQTEALTQMAENDPSDAVRFEAWFTLLAQSKSIDLKAFIALIPKQTKKANVSKRLADHLERQYRSMGKGMRPLLAYADIKSISKSKLSAVLSHFATGEKGSSFTSFSALAKSTETTDGPQHIETDEDPAKMAAQRKRLVLVMFNKPGCKQCEKVQQYLSGLKNDFPLLEIDRRNMNDQRDVLLNQALCDRLQINGAGKAPAVFTQAGGLVAPDTRPEAIAELLQETMEMRDDPNWNEFGSEEIQLAQEHVDESFSKMTFSIIVAAGLLDGVNPCAFATIIFFLSYLQIARRSPKEILMVGVAFILAVFLAYFSIGLVFHGLVEWLNEQEEFRWVKNAMTYLFAGFALLVAVLSLRDGWRARKGKLDEMTLQLPSFLKNRIRGVIRKGAKSRSFVIAAFVSGIIISFLELACTGQVYAPIVFKIQQGSVDAVLYLLYYNLAFISPLVVIFILAYRGMTSDALIRFQKQHTAAVKFATAVLFLLLVLVILFGDQIIKLH